MIVPPPIRVVLELDGATDPIRGVVHDGAGLRAFRGWLELAVALDEVRGAVVTTTATTEGEVHP